MSGFILIIGTTPDYIVKLHGRYAIPLVFLTDRRFQYDSLLHGMPPGSLLFASLEKPEETWEKTQEFLGKRAAAPDGIACFDCDSLLLASNLAPRLGLRFPPWEAIARCRSKFETRKAWSAHGVASPTASLASSFEDTMAFFRSHGENIVLKPIAGSGSELLFHCRNEEEARKAVRILEEELPRRKRNPLFRPVPNPANGSLVDPCACWVAEEFIFGPEFSCDFILQDGKISFIRETGKIKAQDKPFGSVLAYTFPPLYPSEFKKEVLGEILKKAVNSLGFDWGFFMVDYIFHHGAPILLEMTPRPGGDSIPDLINTATGMDTLGLYLDFVQGRFKKNEETMALAPESFASINFFAPKEGKIRILNGSRVQACPHVRKLLFKKKPGDTVILPPKDYDNRLLGFCILEAAPGMDLVLENQRLEQMLDVTIEEYA